MAQNCRNDVSRPAPSIPNDSEIAYSIIMVMMEWAGLLVPAALPSSRRLKGCASSERFKMTTAMLPSVFKKAVVSSRSIVDELIIRFAPGRMNFEKWPM
jgi:hypothetical protein